MSASKRYVLDTNIFIEAHQRYYHFDLCPGFWTALAREHQKGRLFSIDRVRAELIDAGDQLSDWAKDDAPRGLFKGTADRQVIETFGEMANWVQSEAQFTPEAKAQFASVADGWVIAYAKVNELIVVTHEAYAPDARRTVPMPNVCLEFEVEYANPFEMLRELKVKFILRGRKTPIS